MFAKFKRRKELARLYAKLELCDPGTKPYDQTMAEITALLNNVRNENDCSTIPYRPIIVSTFSAIVSGIVMVMFGNYKEEHYIPRALESFFENKVKKDSDVKDDVKPIETKKQ